MDKYSYDEYLRLSSLFIYFKTANMLLDIFRKYRVEDYDE